VRRLLLVSDVHGALGNVEKLARVERDITIVAGDLAECGSIEETVEVLETLLEQGTPVVWVPGNCDPPEAAMMDKGYNVHARHVVLDGIVFAGAGGSLYTPFSTPFEYSDEMLAELLQEALNDAPALPTVMVVHTPPYASGLDQVAAGDYVGSRSLVKIIARVKPVLVATGHIHEAWGAAAAAGSLTVNPGPLAAGRYAVAEIDTSMWPENVATRVRMHRL